MADTRRISLIFPAYNEAGRIVQTVQEAVDFFSSRHYEYEIVVSADGDDGTRELIAEMGRSNPAIKVCGGPLRAGKGHGIRQGLALTTGSIVGYSDADNKTPIEELDKLLPFFEQGYDLVIGSRGTREAQIERPQPLYRQLGSRIFAVIMHLMVGLNDISDTQCGFKFFQRPAALDLFARQRIDSYMFDVEILFLAEKRHYRIAQVPIRWRDDHDSRYNPISGSIRNGIDLFKISFGAYK
jgi:dolichyl-phosphate beta-glucosyltransferase